MGNRGTLFDTGKGDVPYNLALFNNFSATTNPGVTNDFAHSYRRGSVWINTLTNEGFLCTDDTTGAAVWELMTTGSGTPGQVTAPAGSDAGVTGGAAATATSAGGKAVVSGAAGGATSGAGGEADLTGGAGTAGNATGGASKATGGAGQGSAAGGAGSVTGGAGGATGAGGVASVVGGAGGATSGDGGAAQVTGGAGTNGNGNGGSVILAGGAKNGTGIAGGVRVESILVRNQPTPTAKTVSATLTAAELLAGIITVTQGAGANSAQQSPTGTAIQAALPADFAIGDSFDISIINLGGASETATLTVNTDVTIVGRAVVDVAAATASGSGVFRFKKTADHVFVAYRIG